MDRKIGFTCDTNCLDCPNWHRCESPMKLEEETRDFWLNEREQYDEE